MTLAWPISVPATILWYEQKRLRGKAQRGDEYPVFAAIHAPGILINNLTDFFNERQVALKVSNIEELLEQTP